MKVTYFAYVHPGERAKSDKPVFNWHKVLIDEAHKAIDSASEDLNIGLWAPVITFHEAPLRRHLAAFKKGMILELELPLTDKMRSEHLDKSVHPCWIAEVVHTLGYYLLCRWGGARKADGLFWIHGAHASLHAIGYSLKNRPKGFCLVPPNALFDIHTTDEWMEYAKKRVIGRLSPSDKYDGHRGNEIAFNKFRLNQRVETIHDEESSVIAPAYIKRILGRRVLLEYNKADIDKADYIEKDNMWKDMNDDLIYPVGFAESMGLRMTANKKYHAHVEAIAEAIKNEEKEIPYGRMDATKEQVYQWRRNESQPSQWEENMVCEMIDRLDECQNVLKAARVIKVLPDGYLQLGPEGADILNDSFHVHQTSSNLFPMGYAKQYGIALQGPKGDNEEAFEWDSFLKRTNYKVAPAHFFHEAKDTDVPFKVGMKLEAIDQNEKMLCPATVKAVKGRLVLVGFDGWEEEFDQLYDFRSNELLPCGWGEMVGHALQEPVKTKLVDEAEELQAMEVPGSESEDEE